MYVKPVSVSALPIDKFGGVVVAWSRFGGSLHDTLLWVISCGFWKWPDFDTSPESIGGY